MRSSVQVIVILICISYVLCGCAEGIRNDANTPNGDMVQRIEDVDWQRIIDSFYAEAPFSSDLYHNSYGYIQPYASVRDFEYFTYNDYFNFDVDDPDVIGTIDPTKTFWRYSFPSDISISGIGADFAVNEHLIPNQQYLEIYYHKIGISNNILCISNIYEYEGHMYTGSDFDIRSFTVLIEDEQVKKLLFNSDLNLATTEAKYVSSIFYWPPAYLFYDGAHEYLLYAEDEATLIAGRYHSQDFLDKNVVAIESYQLYSVSYEVLPISMACYNALQDGQSENIIGDLLKPIYIDNTLYCLSNHVFVSSESLDWAGMKDGKTLLYDEFVQLRDRPGHHYHVKFASAYDGHLQMIAFHMGKDGQEIYATDPIEISASHYTTPLYGRTLEEAFQNCGALKGIPMKPEGLKALFSLNASFHLDGIVFSDGEQDYLFKLRDGTIESGEQTHDYFNRYLDLSEVDWREVSDYINEIRGGSIIQLQEDFIMEAGRFYSWQDELLPYILGEFEIYEEMIQLAEEQFSVTRLSEPFWEAVI